MSSEKRQNILIIPGTGMVKPLGSFTSDEHFNALWILLNKGKKEPRTINERFDEMNREVFNGDLDEVARKDFVSTLSILFDGDGAESNKDALEVKNKCIKDYLDIYAEHIHDFRKDTLELELGTLDFRHDWLALKAIICSFVKSRGKSRTHGDFPDILSIIYKSMSDNIAITTEEIFPDDAKKDEGAHAPRSYYCDRPRLIGALSAYELISYKLFKHLFRLRLRKNDTLIKGYTDFFYEIAKKHSKLELLDDIENAHMMGNFLSPVGFLTYNWDPIVPFLGMIANQRLNRELLDKGCVWKKVYQHGQKTLAF